MSNHAKGYRWKHDVQQYLAEHGITLHSRETGAAGDDLWNDQWSIECKNQKTIDLAGFIEQAKSNAYPACPVVVIKRRNRNVREGYVVLTLEDFAQIMGTLQVCVSTQT